MVTQKYLWALLIVAGITGCSSRTQRFVDVGGNAPIALDTKTGQYCNPGQKRTNELPLCHDLYKNE